MSYYHPRKAFGNEDVIYKARQYENALQERVKFVHKYETLMRYAQFEQLNGPRSSHRSLAEKLEAIRGEREQALLHRRHKLSALLTAEDTTLQNAIKTGNMNLSERRSWLLSQALALSSHSGPETNLEKALNEDYDEVSMHNSRLAIRRAEAEKKRLRDIENIHGSLHEHGLDGNLDVDERAVDILRQNLFMVEQLREEEKAAVEEDMISMNRKWLEEEEALKLKQLERRYQQSLQAKDLLLHKADEKRCEREDYSGHMVAMAADKEVEEGNQLEELKAAHKREALAFVTQLKAVAERQRIENEELEATIKAKMFHPAGADNYIKGQPSFLGISQNMVAGDQDLSGVRNINMASKLSKKDLVDVLEGQTRGFHAAELVDQEVNRLALRRGDEASTEARMKQTGMDLPYPEPYYGRKAVKWYE